MAGYMKKLQGHVYDGSHEAAVALTNGLFAVIGSDNKVAIAGAKATTTFRVDEKITLWGMPALVLTVLTAPDEIYLVENEFELYGDCDYNKAEYSVKAGHLVKMHRFLPGEQLVVTVETSVAATFTVGDTAAVAANGTVVKA